MEPSPTIDVPDPGSGGVRVRETATGYFLDCDEKPLPPGCVIGPYSIVEFLAEGGFGMVYRALQLSPVRREVALKVIKSGMHSRDLVARFEQERQALAMLNHPAIATVYDAGAMSDGRPYFVMEYVRGQAITEFCDSRRLPLPQRIALFLRLCEAVSYAHMSGIVHRDLTPRNVLVGLRAREPVLKVIDFGIAKSMHGQLSECTLFTQIGAVIGTPEYMSPEQAAPEFAPVDARSDIYSLGVMLYELLTGVTPFERARLMQAGLFGLGRLLTTQRPPPPSERVSKLGNTWIAVAADRRCDPETLQNALRGDLDAIVMRALEPRPERRFADVSELHDALKAQVRGRPIRTRTGRGPLGSLSRRPLIPIGLGVLVLGALVASAIWPKGHATQAPASVPALGSAQAYQLQGEFYELLRLHRGWFGPLWRSRDELAQRLDDPYLRSAFKRPALAEYVPPWTIIGRKPGPTGTVEDATEPTEQELETLRTSVSRADSVRASRNAIAELADFLRAWPVVRQCAEHQQKLQAAGLTAPASFLAEAIGRFDRVSQPAAPAPQLDSAAASLLRARDAARDLRQTLDLAFSGSPLSLLTGEPASDERFRRVLTQALAAYPSVGRPDPEAGLAGALEQARAALGILESARAAREELDRCESWATRLEGEQWAPLAAAVRRELVAAKAEYREMLATDAGVRTVLSEARLSSRACSLLMAARTDAQIISSALSVIAASAADEPVVGRFSQMVRATLDRVKPEEPLQAFAEALAELAPLGARVSALISSGGSPLLQRTRTRLERAGLNLNAPTIAGVREWIDAATNP